MPLNPFTIPARILLCLWAGIVFEHIVYAQERTAIETFHSFNSTTDTVRLGFDDVLQLSVLYDSVDKEDWHYIYRWNTGEKADNISVRFEGKRKVLYIGQRCSTTHWPGEYDTLGLEVDESDADDFRRVLGYVYSYTDDTVILRAPDMEGSNIKYAWSNDIRFNEYMLLPDTEQ